MPHHSRFTPRNDPIPNYRRLGGPQDQSAQLRKISLPLGFDPGPSAHVETLYGLRSPGARIKGIGFGKTEGKTHFVRPSHR